MGDNDRTLTEVTIFDTTVTGKHLDFLRHLVFSTTGGTE